MKYGISANPYTSTSEGVSLLAGKYRPDIIESKTFLPVEHPGNDLIRSIVYLENTQQLTRDDLENKPLVASPYLQYNIANSVGLPSPAINITRTIIHESLSRLATTNTKLMFSVSGECVEDFRTMAQLAKNLNVDYVSVNLSCPNKARPNGTCLYEDSDAVREISGAMVQILGRIPLVAKIGLSELSVMETILKTLAANDVYAVYGINAPRARVIHSDGFPAFGPGRERCGVSGAQIRTLAQWWAQQARSIIDKNNLPLKLFVGGGIVHTEDFALFDGCRPDALFSATGLLVNPLFRFPGSLRGSKL